MKISTFRADITPPVGHPLCAGWYPVVKGVTDPISANGIVLFPEDAPPIVLCALDWAELSNGEYELWRSKLAKAAETQPERVTIHCLHAHEAPWPDRDAQDILDTYGHPNIIMWRPWCDAVIDGVAASIREAARKKQPVTEVRAGKARVHDVASTRRVMGADGKVKGIRWTRCGDAELRAAPDGVIDPFLKTLSFWNANRKIVSLHYYATHPTSYDGTGMVTPDFVGIARDRLAEQEGAPHVYFTECGGNVTAGKYNDGVADNRELFTRRILNAMIESEKAPAGHAPAAIQWRVEPVTLPPRDDQPEEKMVALLKDPATHRAILSRAALMLAYRRRCNAGIPILLSALHLGDDVVSVHTPGEAFVEYQLYAQELRPDAFVVVPSYGDCGPGYVTLARSFEEGGYEPTDSFCSRESEGIMREAIRRLVAKSS